MQQEKKYPIGGYAPGNYYCKCSRCGYEFKGDKRAVQCEPCAVIERDNFDALSPAEQAELMKRNAAVATYMFTGPLSPERDLIYKIVEQWGNAIEMPNMEGWLRDYAGNRRTGPVWVKGKDRVPEKQIYVIVRNIETGQVKLTQNYGHNTGWDIAMDHRFKWDNTEWLDESNEQPVEQKENEAVEFAEWIAINNWVLRNDKMTWHWGPSKIPKDQWRILTSLELFNEYQKQNKQ